MTTVLQKLINVLTAPDISLEWGSHRAEFSLEKHIKLEQQFGETNTIQILDPIIKRRKIFSFDPPVAYILREVSFHPITGTLRANGFVIRESLPWFYKGPHLRIRSLRRARRIPSGNQTAFNISTNYYHFLLEDLPRIILLKELFGCSKIYSAIYDLPSFAREYLSLIEVEVIPVKSQLFFEEIQFVETLGKGILPTGLSIRLLRKYLTVNGTCADLEPKDVYISRKSSQREFFDEDQISQWLQQRGFLEVNLENMSVQEQISLMLRTRTLVGAHGAGLANIAFLPDRATVIEISDVKYANPIFQALASTGLNYHQILVDPDESSVETKIEESLNSLI